jgi:type VI secretion system protein ImpH
MPDLIARLRAAPHTFNLFQAISLLERSAPQHVPVGTGVGVDEAVRLAAHVDFAFAPSDIAAVVDSGRPGPALTLRTPALTLAGGQGPVSETYTELLLQRRRLRDRSGLDFLDIFNGRLLGFWYRARSKHHLALQPGRAAPLPRTLDAMSGLGRAEGARGPAGELASLRHASLQNAAPRSMATLLAILRDRLGVAFGGAQFVGGWHALAPGERARLQGGGTGRQRGISLGARAWDQAHGLALTVPPLAPAQFGALLPGQPQHALLAWLVARHLQADFTVTLTLVLAAPPATRLGARQPLAPRLGRSAWLCSRTDAVHTSRRYQPVRCVLRAAGADQSPT